MTERDFLKRYQPADFERPSVTVDLVLGTVFDSKLHVLLIRRNDHPYRGRWSLPGGFVGIDEDLDRAASRVLHDKVGFPPVVAEQLRTFGATGRDPRMRIISIAHFALLPAGRLLPVLEGRDDLWLAPVSASGSVSKNGRAISLAFDHSEIIAATLERLRSNLNHSDVAFRLLPAEFTLRELQQVHEAILGHSVNKPAFRKRLVDSGLLEATGDRQLGGPFRPAELYRYCGTAQG